MSVPPNFLFLSGFADFSALNSRAQSETSITFNEAVSSLYTQWKAANNYAVNTLPQVDAYRPPANMISDINENAFIKEKKEIIKAYSPYGVMPFEIKCVEVSNTIPAQYHIDLNRVDAITHRFKSKMEFEDLLAICLDTDEHPIPVEKNFIGQSVQNYASLFLGDEDIRLREVDLREVNLSEKNGVPLNHAKAKALVFLLSLGDPFVMAFRFHRTTEDPTTHKVTKIPYVVLANGYHRVYALWKAGYKKIPCVFADISMQEINAFIPNPEIIITTCQLARPPLFRDFFESRLTTQLSIPRRRRILEMRWQIEMAPVFGDDSKVGGQ